MWKPFVTAFAVAACGSSQSVFPSPPADQKLILEAHGIGDQIYNCQVSDAYAWKLKAPDAKLLDKESHVLGRHFAGPAWEAKDGSRVIGKAVVTLASPDPKSIPWLRIDVIQHEGAGILTPVLTVQRLNTKGGKAPAEGCDSAHAGAESRVPYEADYYFYGESR